MSTISWKAPTVPMPMETNPRVVFERMFGRPGSAEDRLLRMRQNRSILDSVRGDVSSLEKGLGARDRVRLDQYLEHVREVEGAYPARREEGDDRPRDPAGAGGHSGVVGRARDADVRPDGAGLRGRPRRASSRSCSTARPASSCSRPRFQRAVAPRVAPRQRAREAGAAREAEYLPDQPVRQVPRPPEGDAGRRRLAARSLGDRCGAAA